MKCIVDNRYSILQPKMLETFQVKNIAENYCKSYIANNPPQIENKVTALLNSLTIEYDNDYNDYHQEKDIMDAQFVNNPYYKNAQIACCIYKKLRSYDGYDGEDLIEELDKCLYPLETLHRRDSSTPIINLGFDDPDVLLHFEKLKVKDLENMSL